MRESKRAWRKAERPCRVEMAEAGDDDPQHRAHHSDPEQFGELSDAGDPPVQQQHCEQADQNSYKRHGGQGGVRLNGSDYRQTEMKPASKLRRLQTRPDVAGIPRKSDAS